jgi:hypothetical protein
MRQKAWHDQCFKCDSTTLILSKCDENSKYQHICAPLQSDYTVCTFYIYIFYILHATHISFTLSLSLSLSTYLSLEVHTYNGQRLSWNTIVVSSHIHQRRLFLYSCTTHGSTDSHNAFGKGNLAHFWFNGNYGFTLSYMSIYKSGVHSFPVCPLQSSNKSVWTKPSHIYIYMYQILRSPVMCHHSSLTDHTLSFLSQSQSQSSSSLWNHHHHFEIIIIIISFHKIWL